MTSFQSKAITWDSNRGYPAVRASLFTHGHTGVAFMGDPTITSGQIRGTIIYATQPIPQQVKIPSKCDMVLQSSIVQYRITCLTSLTLSVALTHFHNFPFSQ